MKNAILFCLTIMLGSLSAQDFKSVDVNYKLNGKNASNTIYIPQNSRDYQLPIRGVIQKINGPLKEFAHKNQIAMIAKLDQGRGFSKELLAAAARAANRPEIEYAGAIVQGISKQGREAAVWAAANKERAIAVILDHSDCGGIGHPVLVKGVPMYFNATYADMYQNTDRRKKHYNWCTLAFKIKQPCTAVIDHNQKGGHGGRGSTDLTAIWLDEAIAYRVPVNIPVGKSYKLIDVDPTKVGGSVTAQISMARTRSFHDKVKISSNSNGDWWMPGPKTAALYLDWVRKNGGSIEKDESSEIENVRIFIDLPADLNRALSFVKAKQWSQALSALLNSKNPEDPTAKMLLKEVDSNVIAHLSLIDKLNSAGDIYSVYINIKNNSRKYKGIPSYDEKLAHYTTLFQDKKNAAKLKQGRDFHFMINNINKTKKLNIFNLTPLKNFAKKYPETVYGKAARKAFDKLSADLSIKLPPQSYFIN